MKKVLYLTLMTFYIFISNMYAQDYNDILTLSSQAEVDAFNYVYVSILIIEGDDIVNLEGLSSLEETEGIIIRNNPLLKNLQGLRNLKYEMFYFEVSNNSLLESLDGLVRLKVDEDGVVIRDNPVLTDISALEGLSIGDETPNLSIYNNPSLSVCCGVVDFMDIISRDIHIYNNAPGCNSGTEIRVECEGLNLCDGDIFELRSQAEIDNFNCSNLNGKLLITGSDITNLDSLYKLQTIGGDLVISYNSNLESLHGLENLTYIGGELYMYSNSKLENLEGLNALTSVGSRLTIWGNGMLLNLKGLDQLQTIKGGIYIWNNWQLQSLEGLTSLASEQEGPLEIKDNKLLTNLSGLENLEKIGGELRIDDNPSLSNLNGLNLTYIGGSLDIQNNISLSDCCAISNLVGTTTKSVYIWDNAPGCSSETQIQIECEGLNVCDDDIIELQSQNDVDNFYYCSHLDGTLKISGYDIKNLDSLYRLQSIGGNLEIDKNPNLESLDGLKNLPSIGGDLIINYNAKLISLDGLENLPSINGNLIISSNAILKSLHGLENLPSIGGDLKIMTNPNLENLDGLKNLSSVGGELILVNNDKLSNLKGLNTLISVDSLIIWENDKLLNLKGLDQLQTINGEIFILRNQSLKNLEGLSSLIPEHKGRISITENNSLTELTGLENLEIIHGDLIIHENPLLSNISGLENLKIIHKDLFIYKNPSLLNITGLENLETIHEDLIITENSSLSNLDGLKNLTHIEGDLILADNTSLSDCCGISKLLTIANRVIIQDNAAECNNAQEVNKCNQLIPGFTANNVCLGEETSFIDISSGVEPDATYLWNFGDGTTSTTVGNVNHIYAAAGEYTVKLTITHSWYSLNVSDTITVHPLPEVTLSPFDPVSEADPAFALSGGSPAGGIYSGEGVSNGIFDPSAVGPGEYEIKYIYTNPTTQCSDSATQVILVEAVEQQNRVVSFTLVNAATDTDIMELTDGMQLYLHALPNVPLNIRANTDPATVGSVFLSLSGPVNASRKEGVAPYALLGDTEGDYHGETFGLGKYTLSATPYSSSNLKGEKGTSLKIDFEIIEEVLDCEEFTASLTNVQNVSACGGNDGSATVEVGGNMGAVTYDWSNGATTATASNLAAGDYTLIVMDEQGCAAMLSVTIENPSLPEVTLSPFDPVNSTDVAFVLSGGSPAGGTYSGEGVSNGMFDPLAVGAGSYEITYTYTDPITQCAVSATQLITVAPDFQGDAVVSFTLVNAATDTDIMELTDGMKLYLHALPNAPLNIRANTDPPTVGSVFLSLSGSVNASRKEGVAPYALLGDTEGNYAGENFGVGNYTLSAVPYSAPNLMGEKGLELSINFSIEEEVLDCAEFIASLTNVQDVSTCGGSDGSATVDVSGNIGTVTYDWSNGAATATASNLAAGDYTLIVMDEQGCAAMLSVTIENPSLPEVALSPFDPVKSTDVAFVLSGGSPAGGTYSGPGVSNGLFDPSAVGAGSYEITYTYTDPETNCTNTASQLITVGNKAITLVLVNTATQQDLFPLHDQSVIDLSVVGTEIGIRAEISVQGTVKRTRFELTGDGYEHIRVEGDIQPYSVFGDIGEMINPWPADDLKEGTYTLKAKPTIRINGVKEILTHTIDFTVVNGQVANLRVSNTGKAGVDKVIEEEATELFPQKITVYPNPFAKVIRIAIADLTDERVEVHLMDLYGRTILLKNMMTSAGKLELEVDAENLPEGTYLLQVKGGEHVKVVKLIKQN